MGKISRSYTNENAAVKNLQVSVSPNICSPEKIMLSFGFCLNEWWGEGPAQVFGTFSRGAILVNEGVYISLNANNLNFKLFLGCIHYRQSKYYAFIY